MKRIAVDIVAQILGKVISSIIGLLAISQICRYLSVEDFGSYTLAFSFLAFFYPVVDLGLNTIAAREIAKDPERIHSCMSEVIFLKLALSLLAVFLILGLVALLGYPLDIRYLIAVATFSLLNTILGTLEVILIVRHRLYWLALSQVFSSMVFLLLVYGVMALGRGASFLIAVQIFSVFLSYLVVLVAGRGFFRLTRPRLAGVVPLFLQALPHGIASLITAYYFNIDVIMLSKLMDESAVAYYSSACRLLAFMVFIPHAIMMSLFPILTRAHQQDNKYFSQIFTFSFYLLMVIGIPVAIWANFYARPIIELIYTNTYQPAVHAFTLLVWAGVGIFASHLAGYTLMVINKQKFGVLISTLALVSNVSMNFWLIPTYGINGAAMATVITEFAVACLGFGLVAHFGHLLPFSWKLIRVLFVILATFVLAAILREINWIVASGLFVAFLGCIVAYFSLTHDRAIFAHT